MSLCEHCRKLLLQGLSVLLGGELFVEVGPFDQQLLDGVRPVLMKTSLQNSLRHLKHVVEVRQRRRDGQRGQGSQLEEGDVEDQMQR